MLPATCRPGQANRAETILNLQSEQMNGSYGIALCWIDSIILGTLEVQDTGHPDSRERVLTIAQLMCVLPYITLQDRAGGIGRVGLHAQLD